MDDIQKREQKNADTGLQAGRVSGAPEIDARKGVRPSKSGRVRQNPQDHGGGSETSGYGGMAAAANLPSDAKTVRDS